MRDPREVRVRLGRAVTGAGPDGELDGGAGPDPAGAAGRLSAACVELLGVDGAAVSLVHGGVVQGVLGSDGALGRHLGELEFTFGEGPGLDAIRSGAPVLAPDLDDPSEQRWPALAGEVLAAGARAVFALPVRVASSCIGVLGLVRRREGSMTDDELDAAVVASRLAALPLMDLIAAGSVEQAAPGAHAPEARGSVPEQLAALERVEVYQATGMLVSALGVGPVEALVRLRGAAVARGMTVTALAWEVVERRVLLDPAAWGPGPDGAAGRR